MSKFGLQLRLSTRSSVRIDRVVETVRNNAGDSLESVLLANGLSREVSPDFGASALRHWDAYVEVTEMLDPVFVEMRGRSWESKSDNSD